RSCTLALSRSHVAKSPPTRAIQKLIVDRERLTNDAVDGEPLHDAFTAVPAELEPQRFVFNELPQCVCERYRIKRRDEETVEPVFDYIAAAGNISGHDRQGARRSLEQRLRQTFAVRRQRHDV